MATMTIGHTEKPKTFVIDREELIQRAQYSGSGLWVVADISGSATHLFEDFYELMDEMFNDEFPFRLFIASYDGVAEIQIEGHEDFSAIEGESAGGGGLDDFSEVYDLIDYDLRYGEHVKGRGFHSGMPDMIIHLTDHTPPTSGLTSKRTRWVPLTIHVLPESEKTQRQRQLEDVELLCFALRP